jgi:TetR/AcrR family transcriptional regulator, transcriptional repressor for nem operon
MEIKRNGSQPSGKGSAEYFTNTVRFSSLKQGDGLDKLRRLVILYLMARANVSEQLIQSGLETVYINGFNASSVQDITAAAGVPKGSFYNHFASKEDFGVVAVQRYIQVLSPKLQILHDQNIASLEAQQCQRGCLLGNFGAELSDQYPSIRGSVSKAFESWAKLLSAVIVEAQQSGSVTSNTSPELLASFILNAWQGAAMRAKVEQSRAPLDTFVEVVFSRILVS